MRARSLRAIAFCGGTPSLQTVSDAYNSRYSGTRYGLPFSHRPAQTAKAMCSRSRISGSCQCVLLFGAIGGLPLHSMQVGGIAFGVSGGISNSCALVARVPLEIYCAMCVDFPGMAE